MVFIRHFSTSTDFGGFFTLVRISLVFPLTNKIWIVCPQYTQSQFYFIQIKLPMLGNMTYKSQITVTFFRFRISWKNCELVKNNTAKNLVPGSLQYYFLKSWCFQININYSSNFLFFQFLETVFSFDLVFHHTSASHSHGH